MVVARCTMHNPPFDYILNDCRIVVCISLLFIESHIWSLIKPTSSHTMFIMRKSLGIPLYYPSFHLILRFQHSQYSRVKEQVDLPNSTKYQLSYNLGCVYEKFLNLSKYVGARYMCIAVYKLGQIGVQSNLKKLSIFSL